MFRSRTEYFSIHEHFEDDEEHRELLQTIRIPKNLSGLSGRLPKSNYEMLRNGSVDSGSQETSKKIIEIASKKRSETKVNG